MTAPGPFDPAAMLAVLVEHQVEFVIIGGLAAYLQAAPIATHDLDIVYARTPENYERLEAALAALGATYRDPAGRRIQPRAHHFASPRGGGHHLLMTRFGPVDALRSSGPFDFERTVASALTMEIEGSQVRVARLEDIIEMKRLANRPKDQLALPTLRAVIEDSQRNED